MRILNFGSLNIDHVYRVERFVRAGETLAASDYERFAGGKGFNQSIALARAGARVAHAGRVGPDGGWLVERLAAEGVDVANLEQGEHPTGHAVIQVSPDGENSILVHGGANRRVDTPQIDRALDALAPGDWLLLQNEISGLATIFARAADVGARITLNPSPMDAELAALPLAQVDRLVLNRAEGEALSGETDPDAIVDALRGKLPDTTVVLTLGAAGALHDDGSERLRVPAARAAAVDTTGAGDTFTGYLLAALAAGAGARDALTAACAAAARCVERRGAADSIPHRRDIAL